MNRDEAIKATRNGAIAAVVSAVMTTIVVAVAMNIDAGGQLAFWNDPWNLLDVLLILACAYGMYRKSRTASVLIFVYFLISKLVIALETGSVSGLGLGLIFLYFYGRAVQGAFVFHRVEKKDNPAYQPPAKWPWLVGAPVLLIVVALMGLGLMSTTGVIPSTRVQTGDELTSSQIETLVNNGIVSKGAEIDYFYSQGAFSILESGNILTDDRVILYVTDPNDELQVFELPISEVTGVTKEVAGDVLNDSVYRVNTAHADRWLKLFLSVEQKGHQKFVDALREKLSE